MKQNKDWTDVMRSALRDAEVTPPADGWARLERELKTPAPRISVLRRYWPRIAAAAAAVLIFVGGGELLLHENRSLGDKGLLSHRQQTAAVPPRTIGHIRPGGSERSKSRFGPSCRRRRRCGPSRFRAERPKPGRRCGRRILRLPLRGTLRRRSWRLM